MYFSYKEKKLYFIYNVLIQLSKIIVYIASFFNAKLKKGVVGRKQTFALLQKENLKNFKTIWLHCASLGEYEQGLPVFKALRKKYTNYKIVLSFFSPSGYEIRKNTTVADVVVYLPLDTTKNARLFLNEIQPNLVVFVKYDLWPNYLKEIRKRNSNAILISALFRKEQLFFKYYGGFFRKNLTAFQHIFVQDNTSLQLLKKIRFTNVSISGDTRFDRVYSQLQENNSLDYLEQFKAASKLIVLGSTWQEDEALTIDFINANASKDTKFVIAPHEIKTATINRLQEKIEHTTVLFSEKEEKKVAEYSIFILNTIGILTKVYSYATIAYVGGAAGTSGLHNTLEPAVFGIPIIIGKNYANFPEAKQMIQNKGMFSVKTKAEFSTITTKFLQDESYRLKAGKSNYNFIKNNRGATTTIIDYLNTLSL